MTIVFTWGRKQVRLDEELYERIAAHNRDEETISRLIRDVSLLDLADGEYDEQRASARKRALDRTAERTKKPLTS